VLRKEDLGITGLQPLEEAYKGLQVVVVILLFSECSFKSDVLIT
jgi:hypothetical protein